MALQLEPTANKVIKIYNTDIELTSVYLRFKYDVSPNGRIVICNSKAYQDKAKYLLNEIWEKYQACVLQELLISLHQIKSL